MSVNALSSALSFLTSLMTPMARVLVVKACHVNEELSVAMPDWNGCSDIPR